MKRSAVLLGAAVLVSCGASEPLPLEPGPAEAAPVPVDPGPQAASFQQDADGDGILSQSDMCPDDAEDLDSFGDTDGCPEPDNDGDAIADADDMCPHEPEVYNGVEDDDGCPDQTEVVVISCPHPAAQEKVFFQKGSFKIRKMSHALLDAVVQVIEDNPQIRRVQVAGHAWMEGPQKKAIALSLKRAGAVEKYLEDRGVDPSIFSAAGYGDLCPTDPDQDGKSRELNRRVELWLLETDAGCTEAAFACQDAVDHGLVPEQDEKYIPGSEYCQDAY
jgi:outer membrane protein OmpA-like peptidoglycan-associated protein